MKVSSVCDSCGQTYELAITPDRVDLIDQIKDNEGVTCPCPRLCGGKINVLNIPDLRIPSVPAPMPLNAQELYGAVNGLGLPDEIPNDPIVVDSLLRSGRVVSTKMETYGRMILLHEITLDSGAVIHLASGARGARVLKITKERPCPPESLQKA